MSQKLFNILLIWVLVLMTIITVAYVYVLVDTTNQIRDYHREYRD